ncbi:MAG: aldo/keto reductase [Proteobacteria bacterium]|nr:aldo/keto reductase [Pseudomonadota bacterium]
MKELMDHSMNDGSSMPGRRTALLGMAATAGMALAGCEGRPGPPSGPGSPIVGKKVGDMPYRKFGRTDLEVSEVGFGAWGIGGQAYGSADQQESLRSLARAEELGCNFVDTALVYGNSELTIGEFLRGRRSKWIVATKYSGQKPGMTATLEDQLRRLGVDYVDLYQIHWVPKDSGQSLYEELYRLKKSGKVRYVGVSLSTPADVDYVLDHTMLDSVMLPFSLLDPLPFLARARQFGARDLAVVARSSLKEGFLVGKYTPDTKFSDPNDQRSKWPQERIAAVVDQVEKFRFLESGHGSMVAAAVHYPLSFPQISTVIMGTMSVIQAEENFGRLPGGRLSEAELQRVAAMQDEMGLWGMRERILRALRGLTNRS